MAKFNYQNFEEELEVLLGGGLIENWEAFGPGHYRINGEIDIWPRRKKYMIVNSWESQIYENLEDIIY